MLSAFKIFIHLAKRTIPRSLSFILFILWIPSLYAESLQIDLQNLQALPSVKRIGFIYDLQLETLDSATFTSAYDQLYNWAKQENDWRTVWDLRFYYFRQRGNLQSTSADNIQSLAELEEVATLKGFKVGQIITEHYLSFEKYYFDDLPLEVLYTNILGKVEEM